MNRDPIRPARPDEVKKVCNQMAQIDPWLRLKIDAPTLLKAIENDPPRQILVYEEGDAIAGSIMFRPAGCSQLLADRGMSAPLAIWCGLPAIAPADALPDGGYVNALTVFPKNQSKGAGWSLLERAETVATAHGSKLMFLYVSELNPDAQRFYKRHGYRQIGRMEDCLYPGNTEHLMVKDL